MEYERFVDDNGKSIIVITNWGDKQKSEEEAIRYAANYYFKCKRDKLKCISVFMESKDANEIYFTNVKGSKKYLAVCYK